VIGQKALVAVLLSAVLFGAWSILPGGETGQMAPEGISGGENGSSVTVLGEHLGSVACARITTLRGDVENVAVAPVVLVPAEPENVVVARVLVVPENTGSERRTAEVSENLLRRGEGSGYLPVPPVAGPIDWSEAETVSWENLEVESL